MEDLKTSRLTSIRLDPETAVMLSELSRDLEGNRSMALRRAVRTDYALRGRVGVKLPDSRPAEAQLLEVRA